MFSSVVSVVECVWIAHRGRNTSWLWKVVTVMSLIVTLSCIKVSKQHDFHWVQWKAAMFTSSVKKCLLLVNRNQFSSCKCRELELFNSVNKRLCGSLWDTDQLSAMICSSNVMEWVKVGLLPSKPCLVSLNIIFESLLNTAPPASDTIYWQNFVGRCLKYDNSVLNTGFPTTRK